MKSKKIEEKVASTVFQETEKVKVGNKVYQIKPATVATLIEVSRLVSQLPPYHFKPEEIQVEQIVLGSLMLAKDCAVIGEIAATMVLGAKKQPSKPSIGETVRKCLKLSHKDKINQLSNQILEWLSPKELNSLIVQQLARMEISDFFGLTTSLLEVNLLRKTKEVV